MGVASNHRFALYDAVLIKENHIMAAGGVQAAVERCRAAVNGRFGIQIEVEDLDELKEMATEQIKGMKQQIEDLEEENDRLSAEVAELQREANRRDPPGDEPEPVKASAAESAMDDILKNAGMSKKEKCCETGGPSVTDILNKVIAWSNFAPSWVLVKKSPFCFSVSSFRRAMAPSVSSVVSL